MNYCRYHSDSDTPTPITAPSAAIHFSPTSRIFSSVSRSVVSNSLWPHGLQHSGLPCASTPGACSNSCPSSQWCHPTTSSALSSTTLCSPPRSPLVSDQAAIVKLHRLGSINDRNAFSRSSGGSEARGESGNRIVVLRPAAAGSSLAGTSRGLSLVPVFEKSTRFLPLYAPPGPNELGPSRVTSFSLETPSVSCSVMSESLGTMDLSSPGSELCPWDSPGKNRRVGCHTLPQGIFPTQESPGISCLTERFFFYCLNVPPKCPDTHISRISVGASTC